MLYQFDLEWGRETEAEQLRSVTWSLHDCMTGPQQKPWTTRLGCASMVGNTWHVLSQIVSGGIKCILAQFH